MFRYYLKDHPAAPGTIPGWKKPTKVHNYARREYIKGIGYVKGYVEYDSPLAGRDEEFYELVRGF